MEVFTSDSLQVSLKGRRAEAIITREESLNALNLALLKDLEEAIAKLRDTSLADCGLLTLAGAGEKAFVAGADIKLMAESGLGQRVMCALETLPIPVIAIVDGFALGGGLELALACDLIVAEEQAKLGQPEVNLGLIPGFGGTQRLAARVGIGAAKKLIYTALPIKAEEAYRIGLVDELVARGAAQEAVNTIAETILTKGPIAMKFAKQAIEEGYRASKKQGLTVEAELFLELFKFEDTKEGLNAFTEKRKANFKAN